MNYILEGLKTAGQFPLDFKLWCKTQDEITLGEDNVFAFAYYKGMMIYCADERVAFEWTEIDNPNLFPATPVLLPEHFTYPDDTPDVEGVSYAGKQYNFFKIVIDNAHINIGEYVKYGEFITEVQKLQADILANTVAINNLSGEMQGKIDTLDEALKNLKTYTDAQNEALEKELELRDKALRGELTAAEAKLLLDLENQRRELLAEINRQSELIMNTVDDLKDTINKEVGELNNAITNLQDQLNSLPTDTELTDRQIDSLVQLLNTVEVEYYDVVFKITVVLRDKFLPDSEKAPIQQLEVSIRQAYSALKAALEKAIEDRVLSKAEVADINAKLDAFKLVVKKVNEDLVAVYDVLGDAKKKYYDDKIADTIVDTELIIEYSQYPDKGWHAPPYLPADIYMRQKNGPTGDWYGPIRIKGENGENGQYTDYQFAKNKDLINPPITGWQDTPPVATMDEYIWSRVGVVTPPATEPPYWTAMRMTGPPGLQGQDGDTGIPGKPGADGRTPYFHTAWADSADGEVNFSTTIALNKSFIGTYTDYTAADSTDPTKYTWAKFRGESIVSNTEPTGKYVGMVWIDTSKTPIEQKYWNGSIWILTGISQSDIAKAIKDANDALQKTMEDALKDGIIDANEAQIISSNLSSLDTNKRILDSQYILLYNDPNLGSSAKTNLQAKKVDFEAKHKALYDLCLAISKKTSVTPAEQTDYNSKQAVYNTSLGEYSKALEAAQQDILRNTVGGIQVIGRNLLALSNKAVSNTEYSMTNYGLIDPESTIKVGETYTVTIWGQLGAGKTHYGIYNSGGNISLGNAVKVSDGVYQVSFVWKNISGSTTVTPTTLNVYAMPNTVTGVTSSIKYIKLEKGPIGTEWSVAIEDIEDAARLAALNAAQAEQAALQIREQLNFLGDAKFDGNSVIAGLLLVGDAKGNNGFFSGITDKGGESIRIGIGGQGYKNKESAVFKVRENGMMEAMNAKIKGEITATSGFFGGFRITLNSFESANGLFSIDSATGIQTLKYPNGTLANEKGIINGVPTDNWYDESGTLVYSLTSKGIIYTDFIPESWRTYNVWFVQTGATNLTKAQKESTLNNSFPYSKQVTSVYKDSITNKNRYSSKMYLEGIPTSKKISVSKYNAGRNPDSESNKQYEKFFFADENKFGAKIQDGWYMLSPDIDPRTGMYELGGAFPYQEVKEFEFTLSYIVGGVVQKTDTFKATSSIACSPVYNEGYSDPEFMTFTVI